MKPARVLIVEDEMIFALDLAERLKSRGYEICELTTNGEKALESCETQKPDIVLIDINLRGAMSGIETAGKMNASLRVPVIFMTGYADRKTREDAETVNPAGYLIKPFETAELMEAVESALGKIGGD